MQVTSKVTPDGTEILIGEHRLVTFTTETPQNEIKKFLAQCETNAAALHLICEEYALKLKWNHDNYGRGRDWPIFSKRERTIDLMCKNAGIRDT